MVLYQGFVFNEGTDWATSLKDGYKDVNTSYDRREELEQENDETREKNAEYPLEIIEGLIELSPTIAKATEAVNKKRRNRMRAKGWDGIDDKKVEETLDLVEDITKVGALESSVVGEALKQGDNKTIQTMNFSGSEFTRARLLSLDQLKLSLPNSLNAFIAQNHPSGFDDVAGFQLAYEDWKGEIVGNLDDAGFNDKFSKSQLKDTFESVKENYLKNQNKNLTEKNFNIIKGKMVDSVVKALAKENPLEAFTKESEYYKGFFTGDDNKPNMAKVTRSFINIGLMGVNEGLVNIDKFEAVVFGEVKAKGDKIKLLIDKVGGGPEHKVWANGIINDLEAAKKQQLTNIQTENSNYAVNYETEIRKLNPNGEMSKEDILNYIYVNPETRWDFTKGPIPESVKGMMSAEVQDDAILFPALQKKAKFNLLTKADVMKLNSATLRQQLMPLAISPNNMGMSQQQNSLAKEAIVTMADHVEKSSMGKKEKSPRWLSIKQQAELLYPVYYAENIKTATSATDAHVKTMAQLTAEAEAGNFDTWDSPTTRTLELQTAVDYLAMGTGSLQKIRENTYDQIIPGYEPYIEQALNLPPDSNEVLLPFKQLGDKLNIPGSVIQHNQKTVANLLKGEKEPIKSEVVLAYEKLTDEQKTLLGKFPTPAKLARAKFLAWKLDSGEGEGVITWSELSVVHEDVGKFVFKEKTGNELPVTPTLGKAEPRKGDWKKLPGATRIGYAVWDGDEWKYSSSRGKNSQKWIGPIEDYKDVDGYYKPFEGTSNDLTTTFFGGDEPINTAEEGGPEVGDWYKVTNKNIGRMDIGDLAGGESKPYVVWNGKEWVYSAVKGKTPNEYQGPQPLSKIDEEEELIKKQAQNY